MFSINFDLNWMSLSHYNKVDIWHLKKESWSSILCCQEHNMLCYGRWFLRFIFLFTVRGYKRAKPYKKEEGTLLFFFPLSHKIHIRYTFKKTVKVTQNEVGWALNIHRHVYAVEFLVKVGFCVPSVLKIHMMSCSHLIAVYLVALNV